MHMDTFNKLECNIKLTIMTIPLHTNYSVFKNKNEVICMKFDLNSIQISLGIKILLNWKARNNVLWYDQGIKNIGQYGECVIYQVCKDVRMKKI